MDQNQDTCITGSLFEDITPEPVSAEFGYDVQTLSCVMIISSETKYISKLSKRRVQNHYSESSFCVFKRVNLFG